MDYRTLGRTGVKVSPLALGAANFGRPSSATDSITIINHALDAGINLIDTSNSYSAGESERIIGEAFKANGRRHQALIATKGHYPTGTGPNDRGNSRLHIMRACEESLRRLQTDYIDLYQLHRPSPDIPIEETLSALTDLVRQGKVRYVGCSTFPAWQIMEAIMMSELKGYVRFVSEQPPYNLLDRRIENERVPLCQKYGLAILPWGPMGMGVLAGRYSDAANFPADSRAALVGGIYAERVTARGIEVGKQFTKIAQQAELTPAQLSLLWIKDQPGITAPLVGVRTLAQLEEAIPVMEMTLSDELRAVCDELVAPGTAVVNFHNTAPWMKMQVSIQ
ncbi:MAG: aldo/keto reductase [Ardenticatenaceae bacterium]|nr:aldo/keto reductase [Ardenticatenaceae bacterium]